MLEKTTIARPYAKAVFEQAQDENDLAKWSTMLSTLSLVVSDPQMKAVMDNPRFRGEQLAELVIDICGEELTQTGQNFVKVLVSANRLSLAPQILEIFENKRAEAEARVNVDVISAYPLDAAQEENIAAVMSKKLGRKIVISTQTDETLIGGAVIRAGDSVIDASLKGRLKQLANEFAE